MEMAVQGNILAFIGERYKAHFKKKKVPSVMRLIRSMNEDKYVYINSHTNTHSLERVLLLFSMVSNINVEPVTIFIFRLI
jgi:collagenase-like PrtC family protease